jgi:hypothetical protein
VDFLTAADPHLKLPYTHQWNVSIEQAFGATNTVTVLVCGRAGSGGCFGKNGWSTRRRSSNR